MTFGVLIFPGSNCDRDALSAASLASGVAAIPLWHKDSSIPSAINCVIVPGGFSYGDYLRCGAIARFSPIMQDVVRFAERGGLVLGICNGFQILCEAGLLPGALLRNASPDGEARHFICRDVHLRVERTDTPFTSAAAKPVVRLPVIRLPIAHGEGKYFADADTLKRIEDQNQVVMRYTDELGNVSNEANPNGSLNNIAGIANERGNVFGLMPHPERACEAVLGGEDGMMIFQSVVRHCSSL